MLTSGHINVSDVIIHTCDSRYESRVFINTQTCMYKFTGPRSLFVHISIQAAHLHSIFWRCGPTRAMASSFTRFLDHTQRHTTVGKTPLDEWSARRRDLYLTTHNTHNRQTSMPTAGFEPTISAGVRPQTYALDRAATGTAHIYIVSVVKNMMHACTYDLTGIFHLLCDIRGTA